MKKAFSLFMALVLCFSLCACNGTQDPLDAVTIPSATEPSVTDPPATDPTEEEALYMPYIGKWVCSDGYYVIVNENGTVVYNGVEHSSEFFEMYGGVGIYLRDAEYTYYAGMDKNGEVYITTKGCVFVWGLTDRVGEGVMVGDHDGRKFILQAG